MLLRFFIKFFTFYSSWIHRPCYQHSVEDYSTLITCNFSVWRQPVNIGSVINVFSFLLILLLLLTLSKRQPKSEEKNWPTNVFFSSVLLHLQRQTTTKRNQRQTRLSSSEVPKSIIEFRMNYIWFWWFRWFWYRINSRRHILSELKFQSVSHRCDISFVLATYSFHLGPSLYRLAPSISVAENLVSLLCHETSLNQISLMYDQMNEDKGAKSIH